MKKTGRDPLYLKNWRPLSLLNVNNKILVQLISNRIQVPLSCVIGEDQSGFLRNRYVGDNILDAVSIIEHVKRKNIDAMLISFDFEKAFDLIEWNILFETMRFFNFGDTIISMIKMLYTDIESCVMNNSITSS